MGAASTSAEVSAVAVADVVAVAGAGVFTLDRENIPKMDPKNDLFPEEGGCSEGRVATALEVSVVVVITGGNPNATPLPLDRRRSKADVLPSRLPADGESERGGVTGPSRPAQVSAHHVKGGGAGAALVVPEVMLVRVVEAGSTAAGGKRGKVAGTSKTSGAAVASRLGWWRITTRVCYESDNKYIDIGRSKR